MFSCSTTQATEMFCLNVFQWELTIKTCFRAASMLVIVGGHVNNILWKAETSLVFLHSWTHSPLHVFLLQQPGCVKLKSLYTCTNIKVTLWRRKNNNWQNIAIESYNTECLKPSRPSIGAFVIGFQEDLIGPPTPPTTDRKQWMWCGGEKNVCFYFYCNHITCSFLKKHLWQSSCWFT